MAETLAERVFRHGFSDGWTASQTGRHAAPAAVDEAWHFYVADGALQKSVEATAPTPATDEREAVARAMCKSDGTSQCAAICLSHFASSTRNGKCAEAVSIWGKWADAALSALSPYRAAEIFAAEARATALLQYAVHHDDCDGRLGPQYHCRCGLRALQHPSTETK